MRRGCGQTRRASGLGRPLRGWGGAGRVGPEFEKAGAGGGESSEGGCSPQGGEGERLWSLPQ